MIESILNKLASTGEHNIITWEELSKMEIGMFLHINEKVTIVKYFETKAQMGFKTILKAGGCFGVQSHDCLEEILVLRGDLVATQRGNKVYTKGQTVAYLQSQVHRPCCTVDSIYKVVFTKSKIQ